MRHVDFQLFDSFKDFLPDGPSLSVKHASGAIALILTSNWMSFNTPLLSEIFNNRLQLF